MMSSRVLSYEGFQGSVEVSLEDNCLYGKLLHIDDLVTYEAVSPEELQQQFESAVRDYLEDCRAAGRQPNKPFKGSLNIRIGAELHECAAKKAASLGMSLNDFIRDAVSMKLGEGVAASIREVHHHEHHYYEVARKESAGDFGFSEEYGFSQCHESSLLNH